MKTRLYFVGVLITGMLGAYAVGRTVAVPAFAQTANAPKPCSVPKSYGNAKLVAYGNAVGFEDASGTIRWVRIDDNCKVEYLVVRP